VTCGVTTLKSAENFAHCKGRLQSDLGYYLCPNQFSIITVVQCNVPGKSTLVCRGMPYYNASCLLSQLN
jgi:hypothetical protein